MNRILEIGNKRATEVMALDIPGTSGVCHRYRVLEVGDPKSLEGQKVLAEIGFQNGPVREVGVNGVRDEDLIVIVIDRLRGIQEEEYVRALDLLEIALTWLDSRIFVGGKNGEDL